MASPMKSCEPIGGSLEYTIRKYEDGYYLYINSRFEGEMPDLASAKAHAQADFEAKIKPCLIEDSQS